MKGQGRSNGCPLIYQNIRLPELAPLPFGSKKVLQRIAA
jgi:hypothetical protein